MATTNINKVAAILFGAVFTLVGLLGFVGALTPKGGSPAQPQLLGLFAVTTLHNIVHLGTGIGLLAFGFANGGANARTGLLVFGAVYGLVTVLGFVGPGLVRSLGIGINTADNLLHVVLTIALLGVPLAFKDQPVAPGARSVAR